LWNESSSIQLKKWRNENDVKVFQWDMKFRLILYKNIFIQYMYNIYDSFLMMIWGIRKSRLYALFCSSRNCNSRCELFFLLFPSRNTSILHDIISINMHFNKEIVPYFWEKSNTIKFTTKDISLWKTYFIYHYDNFL